MTPPIIPFIGEALLVIFFLLLGFWYKKSSQKLRDSVVTPIIVGVILLLGIGYGVITWLFLEDASAFTHSTIVMQSNMKKESKTYIPLMTTIFDKAEKENIRKDIDEQYNDILGGSYSSTYREASYFIRLKGDTLQKLFQSGDLKNEVIDTPGERRVAEMLQGERPSTEYPQYTCCGGNDFFPDIPFFRHLLPERRYLKDFPSELERILLITDEQGNIVGAKVSLHGD